MAYEVEFTAEFESWWDTLSIREQTSIGKAVELLQAYGPELSRPHVDTLKGTRFPNLKELRVRYDRRPLRILFAFDPRRIALLLLGGDKSGNARWYESHIAKAEGIYEAHLRSLASEKDEDQDWTVH